jgi:hypothetical protein
MSATQNGELEWELEGEFEGEFEGEYEDEFEGEATIGGTARSNGGMGEYEDEYEDEYEGEFEDEFEGEFEGEYEGEEFIRRIRKFARRLTPALKPLLRAAVPIVSTAVGGPAGGLIAKGATQLLREGEMEYEDEFEGEWEGEDEFEGEFEAPPVTAQHAQAEMMAAIAARTPSEAEAEAMIGAALVSSLSPRDRAALRRVLPHMIRGVAILARILRRRRITRPAIRTIPTIVHRTARTLSQRAAAGKPVSPRTAGQVMARQTQRVLGNPRATAAAMQHNVRAARAVARPAARMRQPRRLAGAM